MSARAICPYCDEVIAVYWEDLREFTCTSCGRACELYCDEYEDGGEWYEYWYLERKDADDDDDD